MTALSLEVADGLRRLAEPIPAGDKVKAQITRAARAAGLTYSRAFEIWYGRARRIDAFEVEAIRAARLRRSQERSDELGKVAADFEILAGRIARLMETADRESADRARSIAGRLRNLAEGR